MLVRRREQSYAEGGRKAELERASNVRSKDYAEHGPRIKVLKREGRHDDALALTLECVEAAERSAQLIGADTAPTYTNYAAIEYRRCNDFASEVAVLARYLNACTDEHCDSRILKRLEKARLLEQSS
jgi:hypothetical protein